MRLFVSIDLPGRFAERIAALQEELSTAEGIRPTDPTQTHVTMKFLGEVDEDRIPELGAALEKAIAEADVSPFEAEYGGLGVFPSLEYISVVWLGVREGSEEMGRLHEAVERETTALGFDPAEHDFTPHATLARMDHAGGKELVQRLVRERDPTVGRTTVRALRLTESELGPDGPAYSTLRSYPLDSE
ncbi:RNA 2',3'-cyclic phosphodiesterase [Halalkalicoccus jeotgali]|uniref:RNA 2',3'-cyclic phosphodiesterase n=1 Tax=Halalkalicoccus jeotgali (strain DSM 18796 / CECT 7217 / JCM 14584 / KCTC 4019 / B3) TaxID=795797 RepID=D8J591_HALJB|nr:RNA 2',3'-cyclic phosphodiesterase [Halalkalicoccus jeotgali]ADJ13672.1 2'-5' RNA ligase [Halalkalicoccus jeotgali B3]ELY34281.1 2'-5' RNA ligase [Halalkalicoccus jeotgali B3]